MAERCLMCYSYRAIPRRNKMMKDTGVSYGAICTIYFV